MDKDQNNDTTPAETVIPVSTSGQFMDIQAPKPATSEPEVAIATEAENVNPTDVAPEENTAPDAPENVPAEEPAAEPVADTPPEPTPSEVAPTESSAQEIPVSQPESSEQQAPSSDVAIEAPPEAAADTPPAETTPEAQAPEENPLAIPPQPPKHNGAPIMAIILAVVVALGLAGLAVFLYLKNNKTDEAAKTSKTSTQSVAEKPQASVSDVDTTNQEIDTNLKAIDDTKDFSTTELSDTTLGL